MLEPLDAEVLIFNAFPSTEIELPLPESAEILSDSTFTLIVAALDVSKSISCA
ncbi:hypothetical protein D3C86_2099650 [compost metagenome]